MLKILRRFGLLVGDLKAKCMDFIWPLVECRPGIPSWTFRTAACCSGAYTERAWGNLLRNKYVSITNALEKCELIKVRARSDQICLGFMDKLMKNPAFYSWVPRWRGEDTGRSLRNSHLLSIPKARTEICEKPHPQAVEYRSFQSLVLCFLSFLVWSSVGWLIIMFLFECI